MNAQQDVKQAGELSGDSGVLPAVAAPLERRVRPLEWMPVLGHPLAIRAELLDADQAMTNHGQTLERLAERGGLSLSEAAAIVDRRRWRELTADDAMAALKRAAERHHRRPAA